MKAIVAVMVLCACGGAVPAAMNECTRDTDCKGDRVCTGGACVDPKGGAGGGRATGAGGGQASGAGGGSGTMQPAECVFGRDDECPTGNYCKNKVCAPTTKGVVADACTVNANCAGNACLFRNSGDVQGYCSKVCQSFGECPSFWDCKNIANGASTYCVQK